MMVVVVFEFRPKPGQEARYFDLAISLKPLVEGIDGFISIERAASVTNEGKFISVSFWRDREAVEKWHAVEQHRAAQALGKSEIFSEYRITVADILRQYSMGEDRPAT
jgi:heme-degrading monooxygenase HmoA